MSEFGKGFIYNLINFAKHFDKAYSELETYEKLRKSCRDKSLFTEERALVLWINGASDHLFDIEVPKNLPEEIKKKIEELQNTALDYGHGTLMMTKEGMPLVVYSHLREKLNEIALMIDKWLNVETEVAEFD